MPHEKNSKSYSSTVYEEEEILVDQGNIGVQQACKPIFGREKKYNIILRSRLLMLHMQTHFIIN
jgi:hypothetical protein